MNEETVKLEGLRSEALGMGIDLSDPKRQAAIEERRKAARQIAARQTVKSGGFYGGLEWLITGAGNALTLTLILLLANIMLPVGIVGLWIVEVQRVSAGVSLFDPAHAALMAIVAVSVYMVLLAVRAHTLITYSGSLEKPIRSARLTARSLAYMLGVGTSGKWKVQTTDPLHRLESTIARVGWVIILLGTVGSMAGKLSAVEGTWFNAILSIFTDSSLTDFLTYAGGFTFTAALLAATHWIVGYSYEQFVTLRPDVIATSAVRLTAEADRAEADYLTGLIAAKRDRQAAKEADARPTPPPTSTAETARQTIPQFLATPTPAGNGNGNKG